ncbi:transcription antitermination factor NusB [Helicobacter sp. 11S02629-2]|uniref:transcription antitermination factor NusB n=1 Tax=Helicobacter sp. 11S02629-2 TaxID=1476195 RepID=UPI000BA6E76F|nr:transcription antitermination factor NusB [Helicobacter sp. 11S02629-2]PAF44937.1 transcription antitermination factor NusB [Helicobacter sp. 11S02629-2]
MATRFDARICVVQLLYAQDLESLDFVDRADDYFTTQKIKNKQKDFASALLKGILSFKDEIDLLIRHFLKDWDLDRLGVLEKAILRLGIYEVLFTETDNAVAINESLQLVREFYNEEKKTINLINGMLDAISKTSKEDLEDFKLSQKELLLQKEEEQRLKLAALEKEVNARENIKKDRLRRRQDSKGTRRERPKEGSFKAGEFKDFKDKRPRKESFGGTKDFKRKETREEFQKEDSKRGSFKDKDYKKRDLKDTGFKKNFKDKKSFGDKNYKDRDIKDKDSKNFRDKKDFKFGDTRDSRGTRDFKKTYRRETDKRKVEGERTRDFKDSASTSSSRTFRAKGFSNLSSTTTMSNKESKNTQEKPVSKKSRRDNENKTVYSPRSTEQRRKPIPSKKP